MVALKELESIADMPGNGGSRSVLQGFDQSVAYFQSILEAEADCDVVLQPFEMPVFTQYQSPKVDLVSSAFNYTLQVGVDVKTMNFGGNQTIKIPPTEVFVAQNYGCDAKTDFEGASGKIVLVWYNPISDIDCTSYNKSLNAYHAGAVAILIANDATRHSLSTSRLRGGSDYYEEGLDQFVQVPTLAISYMAATTIIDLSQTTAPATPTAAPVSPSPTPVSPPTAAPIPSPTATPVLPPVNPPVNTPILPPVAVPTPEPVVEPVQIPTVPPPMAAPITPVTPTNPPVNTPVLPPVPVTIPEPVVEPVPAPIIPPPTAAPVTPPITTPIVPINPPADAPVVVPPTTAPVVEPVAAPIAARKSSNAYFAASSGAKLALDVSTSITFAKTNNLLCTTRGGDANNLLVFGAHLDSVPAGPGIDDNGSGASMLLEVAKQLKKNSVQLKNKIQFSWWGAEEPGQFGSRYWVNNTRAFFPDTWSKIRASLNFDTIGSPNGAPMVFNVRIKNSANETFPDSATAGSIAIQNLFTERLKARGKSYMEVAFEGGSDYSSFIRAGIPTGGLHTGADETLTVAQSKIYGGLANADMDPCYHEPCDRVSNIGLDLYATTCDSAAYTIYRLGTQPNLVQWLNSAGKTSD